MPSACRLEPLAPWCLVVIIDGISPSTALADVFVQQIATVKSIPPDVYLPSGIRL